MKERQELHSRDEEPYPAGELLRVSEIAPFAYKP